MDNKYRNTMAQRSEEQLNSIISQPNAYEPEAFIAAVEELEKRGQGTPELAQMKQEAIKRRDEATQHQASNGRVGIVTLLKPTQKYFYTPLILYANITVWLIMVLSGVSPFEPTVEHLINWGGNLRGLTLDGEPWRLITNTFLHIGAIHLLLNMYTLISTGYILEPAFGRHRYFICYLATGILASIASVAYHDNIVSAGASGAIFGLEGLLLALLITKNIDIPHEARKSLLSSTAIFIGYNLVYGLANTGIDNAAHIGGLLSGILFGFLYSAVKQSERVKLLSGGIVTVVILAVILAPTFISNKYGEYQRAMEKFAELEEKALWMYKENLPDSSGVNDFQTRIQVEGVALWKESLGLLSAMEDMPENLQQRIDLLKTYSELRIKSCEAYSVLAGNNTEQNAQKVTELNEQIGQIIDQLEKLN